MTAQTLDQKPSPTTVNFNFNAAGCYVSDSNTWLLSFKPGAIHYELPY